MEAECYRRCFNSNICSRANCTRKALFRPPHFVKDMFPTCGKRNAPKCPRGGIHAKAAWQVPAKTAREHELSRVCPENENFLFIPTSDGNGRAERHAQDFGISAEKTQMHRQRRVCRRVIHVNIKSNKRCSGGTTRSVPFAASP